MIALHRKYRPKRFVDLDQTAVREFFLRVLSSGAFSQAYLFSGPKGTGKTSAARILARTLNCEQNLDAVTAKKRQKLVEPCGECESCLAIGTGASQAVVEMDAASNRGIDDIRVLREQVGYVTAGGVYTVYIVDEVHMLTTEAFNALLKTLEEPPEHVVFCLCTTEEHKLPATIVSRCTKVSYSLASEGELVRSLSRVAEGEGLTIEKAVLGKIAELGDGSFRDAVGVLEQLSSLGREIRHEDVDREARGADQVAVLRLYESLMRGSAKESLSELEGLGLNGVDMKYLSKQLLSRAVDRIREQASEGSVDTKLTDFVEVFSKVYSRFSMVPIASLPMEMAVVEYCLKVGGLRSERVEPKATDPVVEQVKLKKDKVGSTEVKAISDDKKTGNQNPPKVKSGLEKGEQDKNVGRKSYKKVNKRAQGEGSKSGAKVDLEQVRLRWGEVLNEVSNHNHGLVTLLKRAQVEACSDGKMTLVVGYKFHKEQLEQERYLLVVEKVMESVLGSKLKVVVQMGEVGLPAKHLKEHENVSGKIDDEDRKLVETVEEVFGV